MTYRAQHTIKPPRKRPWKRGLLCVPPPKGKGCGQRFRSDRTFSRHRYGPHDDEGGRKCLTPAEMKAKGWVHSPRRGGWTDEPRQRQLPGLSEVSA